MINEVITISHYENAQEAVINLLASYLQQQSDIIELLAMPDVAEFDF